MPPRMSRPLYIAYRVAEMAVSLFSRFLNAALFGGSTHQTTSARAHIEPWPKRKAIINGVLEAITNGPGRNTNYTGVGVPPLLIIGARAPDGGAPWLNGHAALIRVSATAPTADQIAKIYEDEKVLLQENAQATLFGSSDAVTALAHDPVTNLLHVGTSAGRSVFEGLRRVGNTTTSVSTAISASGGLVVEK